MVRMVVMVERYERYGCGDFRRVVAEGQNEKEAFLKILDHIGMYQDSDLIAEMEEEDEVELTFEEILDLVMEENGDGCDYIFYLADELNNKVYTSNMQDIVVE